jgi:tetratricopeptide (TPR) repeat protein
VGFRFFKSIRLGKFIRLNVSKGGVGGSIGIGGLRVGLGPRGTRLSADLPGGLSYVKEFGGSAGRGRRAARKGEAPQRASPATPAPVEIPEPGFFAPGHEKELAKGLRARGEGRAEEALGHFLSAAEGEPGAAVVAAALLAEQPGQEARAVALLEGVVGGEAQFPTELTTKYLSASHVNVRVTPHVSAAAPVGALAAALLLVELYQEQGRAEEAAGLLEELEELSGDPALTLSLCELYAELGVWDGIVERASGVEPADDISLETRVLYGRAMQAKGLHEAAVKVFTDALRKKKGRNPALLREALYWRAVSYEQLGKKAQAAREFQKLYAEAPDFRDLARRLTPEAE